MVEDFDLFQEEVDDRITQIRLLFGDSEKIVVHYNTDVLVSGTDIKAVVAAVKQEAFLISNLKELNENF